MTAIRKIVSIGKDYLHIKMPEEFKGKKVEVLIFPVMDTLENQQEERIYNFSDVAGKMNWQGNAVSEQRKLRDEW